MEARPSELRLLTGELPREDKTFEGVSVAFSYPSTRQALTRLFTQSTEALSEVAEDVPERYWRPELDPKPKFVRAVKNLRGIGVQYPELSQAEIIRETKAAVEKLHAMQAKGSSS